MDPQDLFDKINESSQPTSNAIDRVKEAELLNSHSRGESIKTTINWATINAIKVLYFSLGLIFFVWMLHLLLPSSYSWLSDNQLKIIYNIAIFFLGGIVNFAFGSYLKSNK